MIKEFNSLEEIEEYYDEKSNTYIFIEDDEYIDLVVFNFDLDTSANIEAWDIYAWNIYACNIAAENIKARNISYYAVCFACDNIKCNSIIGRRNNAKHFVLDGKLEIANDQTI